MTPAIDAALLKRRKNASLVALLGVSLIYGIVTAQVRLLAATSSPVAGIMWVASILALFTAGFVWLHFDGLEHRYTRSPAFNAGIVLLAIVFVPVYFWLSRPRGGRARPILGFFGMILASAFLSAMGSACVFLLQGHLPA